MTKSKTILKNAWECAAGLDDDGWYMVALVRTGADTEYIHTDQQLTGQRFPLKDGKTLEDYLKESPSRIGRELKIVREDSREKPMTLSTAARISRPAVPKLQTENPLACWCEKTETDWALKIYNKDKISTVLESDAFLAEPAVAAYKEQPICAMACSSAEGREVILLDAEGRELYRCAGMRPVLTAVKQQLVLLYERYDTEADGYRLRLVIFENDSVQREIDIPAGDDMNIHGDLTCNQASGDIWVVHESSPRWGFNEFIGGHRTVHAWVLKEGAAEFRPAPGTVRGNQGIPQDAFCDFVKSGGHRARDLNMPPIQPHATMTMEGPLLTWMRFRFRGFKSFGWDVWGMLLGQTPQAAPRRLSPNFGLPDAGYGIVINEPEYFCFQPCVDQPPARSLELEEEGKPWGGAPNELSNNRVEVFEFDLHKGLPDPRLPANRKGCYTVYAPTDRPGAEPPRLQTAPDDLQLVWGDIHAHSIYSKCMSAADGSPEEVLRFQRDVLGCKVLALTEHTVMMNENENSYHFDMLEAEAGSQCVPLYGCEPGATPGHHTNFYTIDREIMERLRAILMTVRSRDLMYREIKKQLPAGSVYVFRHYHGDTYWPPSVLDPGTVDTWDPELEHCMEAMQVRGNTMTQFGIQQEGHPPFPTNFLNGGARLGLVGGTDHCGGVGVNHFGLTGFWTPEVSPEAIWECLRDRKTIACSNGKLGVWATLENKRIGEEVEVGDAVNVDVELSSARPIRRVCLLRNGETVHWEEVEAQTARLTLSVPCLSPLPQWYSVTAEGEGTLQDVPLLAHASPFFVSHPS
ncbi:MAG: hypothetical protein ACOC29_02440 [Candidatus Sumerlaeota bacterium]